MTLLIDASALVAMAANEPEAHSMAYEIDRHDHRLCCSVGLWEAARAIARKRTITAVEARQAREKLLRSLSLKTVAVGESESRLAIEAHDRYGEGRHPARLNMGDCFAYACAKINDAKLLYKGDDFAKTDLA